MSELTLDLLRDAVKGGVVAIRARTELEPIGGPNDKVFPPTFGDEMRVPGQDRRTKYAVEMRRINGEAVLCVLLDSVASQANRFEEALLEEYDAGELQLPMVRADFRENKDDDPALDLSTLGGDGFLTALEVPHRIADALLRDCTLNGLPFRASPPGQRYTEASPSNATAVYELCPTALIFGVWDSTGPKGGLGSKFQRALVSEITGINVELGVKASSRIDPVNIQKKAGVIYQSKIPGEDWTFDIDNAKHEKGKPVLCGKDGAPSEINHGNIPPQVDMISGGVTLDSALQTTTLSLPALRRLRFPSKNDGQQQRAAELAARTALAALALASVTLQRAQGYDLRSRCAFRPLTAPKFELISSDGSDSREVTLSRDGALKLVREAAEQAAQAGMPAWDVAPIDLVPMKKLVRLIRESRRISAQDQEEV